MILFYFESKIMMMLDKKYTNVGNLINENTLETLKNYILHIYILTKLIIIEGIQQKNYII